MARLSSQEVESLKAAGQVKHQARLEKKELTALLERLKSVNARMSRVVLGYAELTDELSSEVKALFLPDKSEDFKAQAYRMYLAEYEDLIFYSWRYKDLCDSAFEFWDSVLKKPNTKFTGNSIIKLIGSASDRNLELVMTHHKDKFCAERYFANVLKLTVERRLCGGFEHEVLNPDQKVVLHNILKMF